ncbi:hypothetical protein DVB69_11470 [Sporosarcina sp. BI001-red]|uniref:hypothetical protein n=1 Tax=Sporosarcina sp. BI001-red TaxID=2282866 RepID=UPI000E24F667|nr:hypothetical protein [Sporosarcina sp. BI001-red]REB07439.1 hypothetical protein DVB69_11470 [Sporosarcina sp. BI001-red]
MRKQLFFLLTLIVVLSGCSGVLDKRNTLSVSDLTDREQGLLSIYSDNMFVYDYHVDKDFKEVTIWVEKYEAGKFMDEPVSSIITPVEAEGTIMFSMQRPLVEYDKNVLNLAVTRKDGSGSVQNIDEQPVGFQEMASTSSSFPGELRPLEEENVLATICFSKESNGMSSMTSEFYEDPEGSIEKLGQYDLVYVLKIQFNK